MKSLKSLWSYNIVVRNISFIFIAFADSLKAKLIEYMCVIT